MNLYFDRGKKGHCVIFGRSHGGKMSAILRASGTEFDVDAFVADSGWTINTLFHRGDPILRGKRTIDRKHDVSGISVVVSEAEFHEFDAQLRDAIGFLKVWESEVCRLVRFQGVEGVVLDFGVEWLDVAAQSDRFPAELVRLAGACGIGLEVSHYPISSSEQDGGK